MMTMIWPNTTIRTVWLPQYWHPLSMIIHGPIEVAGNCGSGDTYYKKHVATGATQIKTFENH